MDKWLLIMSLACLAGCARNLGSPDAPQKFQQEVRSQFELQMEAVENDPTKSAQEKSAELARIEREQASFESYNHGRRDPGR